MLLMAFVALRAFFEIEPILRHAQFLTRSTQSMSADRAVVTTDRAACGARHKDPQRGRMTGASHIEDANLGPHC